MVCTGFVCGNFDVSPNMHVPGDKTFEQLKFDQDF